MGTRMMICRFYNPFLLFALNFVSRKLLSFLILDLLCFFSFPEFYRIWDLEVQLQSFFLHVHDESYELLQTSGLIRAGATSKDSFTTAPNVTCRWFYHCMCFFFYISQKTFVLWNKTADWQKYPLLFRQATATDIPKSSGFNCYAKLCQEVI